MADEKHDDTAAVDSPEIHFDPIVSLPVVPVKSMEEEEEELIKLRAKLFRFHTADKETPGEWKERGVGDVKILRHRETKCSRIVMRRDKTLKICANHLITPEMKMVPSAGSDRAWVWSTLADFADEEAKIENLAIRFKNAETAQKFKEVFIKAQSALPKKELKENGDGSENDSEESETTTESTTTATTTDTKAENKDTDTLTDKLGDMSVKDSKSEECNNTETAANESKE
ncbi:ran-specific GTPase-activating protein-like [Tubulanus polymorphus]|uniref:ran-specific GTPase-activating protein-like n=1 Tax=Tubulanus polymorphus TaxID=672921 RepID=UPI003DA32ED8